MLEAYYAGLLGQKPRSDGGYWDLGWRLGPSQINFGGGHLAFWGSLVLPHPLGSHDVLDLHLFASGVTVAAKKSSIIGPSSANHSRPRVVSLNAPSQFIADSKK